MLGRLTRAFVSQSLGRQYFGYVSPTTVEKVRHELKEHDLDAVIHEEDGCEMNATPDNFAHMVLTCPPYGDIEKYESVTGQLSDIKDYKKFCDRIQVCGDNIERVLVPSWVLCMGMWRLEKRRTVQTVSFRLYKYVHKVGTKIT